MQVKTITTSAVTLQSIVDADGDGDQIVAEATRNWNEMSVVIYNNHGSENLYIATGWVTATATHHPIKIDKSFSLLESDLSKISLVAGASNDAVFITISK